MKKLAIFIVLVFTFQISVLSQPCLPEGITFSTQAEIDSFQFNFPNCTEIEGDVEIRGDDISNLNGLIVLTSIGGNLIIGEWLDSNPNLDNLEGLNNLTKIGGELIIGLNYALTNLNGLNNLDSIDGNLNIHENNVLLNLEGLDNLTYIGEDLEISMHPILNSIESLVERS